MKEISVEELYPVYKNVCRSKVCTDTRKIIEGSLFFALSGPRFNANQFVKEAIDKGCRKAVCSDPELSDGEHIFFSSDPLKSLQELASYHRKHFNFPVIAVGGSNGKTTHKELMHAVLKKKYRSVATQGNLNNHIGVPLTLLQVDEHNTDFLIVEMGANHIGEHTTLCRIADPDYVLVTNVGKDHLEGYGSLEGVKKGNGELYEYIRQKKGKIFLHTSDPVLTEMARDIEYIGYGQKEEGNLVSGYSLSEDPFELAWKSKDTSSYRKIRTRFTGSHYLPNVLSALCVGAYWNVPAEMMEDALTEYIPSMNRSQKIRTGKNEILLDAYNANPDSMKVTIDSFLKIHHPEKWMILGDMLELGDYSAQEHQALCNYLKEHSFNQVFLVGEEFYRCSADLKKFKTLEACRDFLRKNPLNGKYILLKGSRGLQLEKLIEVL